MPLQIPAPKTPILVKVEPLTADAFSPFGTAVSNPQSPSAAISANQGSALKYVDISPLLDFYVQAPSHVPSKAAMSMFVSSPRILEPTDRGQEFKVEILERHPFTTQTFSPLGLSKNDTTKFLVIVAPSLPLSELDIGLPVPRSSAGHKGVKLPGRGLPDLKSLKAFLADGCQAVTYAAGTWHAPMVVLGRKEVAFVVSQFVNGVAVEDCQEVVWGDEGNVRVVVPVLERKEVERQEAEVEKGDESVQVVTDRLGVEGKKAIHGEKGVPKL